MFTLDSLKMGFSIPLILTAKVIGFGSTSDVHEIDLEFSFKYEICNWFLPKIAENRPNNILFICSIYFEFFSLFWSVFYYEKKTTCFSRLQVKNCEKCQFGGRANWWKCQLGEVPVGELTSKTFRPVMTLTDTPRNGRMCPLWFSRSKNPARK